MFNVVNACLRHESSVFPQAISADKSTGNLGGRVDGAANLDVMTWEKDLFAFLDDLEGQAEGSFGVDRQLEVADRARGEYAVVTLAERLMASVGRDVRLTLSGVGPVAGTLSRVADGWCLLDAVGQEFIARVPAIIVVDGLSDRAVPVGAWPVTAKLGFGSALRRIAESGERCGVRCTDGGHYDVRPLRVGADFLEAEAGSRAGPEIYPFTGIAAVHTAPGV